MADLDAYGNALPRAARQQLAKEQALYRSIGRALEAAASDAPPTSLMPEGD